jgi:hypothetical protein
VVVGFLTMPLIFTSTFMVPTTFMPVRLAELAAWNALTDAAVPVMLAIMAFRRPKISFESAGEKS